MKSGVKRGVICTINNTKRSESTLRGREKNDEEYTATDDVTCRLNQYSVFIEHDEKAKKHKNLTDQNPAGGQRVNSRLPNQQVSV